MEVLTMSKDRVTGCILFLSVAVALTGGCVSLNDNGNTLRVGEAHFINKEPELAEKKADKALRKWKNNHAAMVLKAKAAHAQGDAARAIRIINEMDQLCEKDMCLNEKKHMEALLFRDSLSRDGDELIKTGKKISSLEKKLRSRQYASEIRHYINEERPRDAARAFEKLEAIDGENMTSDLNMIGFVLFHTTFHDRTEELYERLTPRQKAEVRESYDISF
jgi:tetratricopeptide (TPR) repeat protein